MSAYNLTRQVDAGEMREQLAELYRNEFLTQRQYRQARSLIYRIRCRTGLDDNQITRQAFIDAKQGVDIEEYAS